MFGRFCTVDVVLTALPEGDGGTEGSEKFVDSSLARRRATTGEFRAWFNRWANGCAASDEAADVLGVGS